MSKLCHCSIPKGGPERVTQTTLGKKLKRKGGREAGGQGRGKKGRKERKEVREEEEGERKRQTGKQASRNSATWRH